MRFTVALIVMLLALIGSVSVQAQPQQYRSEFMVGRTPACDDRYLQTCDVRGWKQVPDRTERHRRKRRTPYNWQPRSMSSPSPESSLVAEARRWMGTNPTGMARLWCARFMNFVLGRLGYRGTGSDLAMSFRHYGHPIAEPQVGSIVVLTRRGGGHVGVVSGVTSSGNPIIVSGNHGRRVGEGVYPRSRVVAYVLP